MKDKYFYLEVIDHKDINVWYSSIDIAGAEKFKSLDGLLVAMITHAIDDEMIMGAMAQMMEQILREATALQCGLSCV